MVPLPGVFQNNVICALLRGNRAIYAQNHLVSIERSLSRDTGKYLVCTFTGLGIIALKASGRDCTNNIELLHKIGVLQRYGM